MNRSFLSRRCIIFLYADAWLTGSRRPKLRCGLNFKPLPYEHEITVTDAIQTLVVLKVSGSCSMRRGNVEGVM
ncbi:hypothetical protein AB6A40_004702 [Gnathostoma spinigerum]|uniref:Uncharacterized protein n=1 Tax=Gnathostoma spinigerum TaxID=75299 RepID=A0ABD6ED96_9BILA